MLNRSNDSAPINCTANVSEHTVGGKHGVMELHAVLPLTRLQVEKTFSTPRMEPVAGGLVVPVRPDVYC
jgi:hypothetical protein